METLARRRSRQKALKENNLFYDSLADFSIYKLSNTGLRHEQLMLERSRVEPDEKPAFVNVYLLRFQCYGFSHHAFPTRHHCYFVELTLETVCPD